MGLAALAGHRGWGMVDGASILWVGARAWRRALRALPLALCLFPLALSAQTRLVEILSADNFDGTSGESGDVVELVGNVQLRQDTTDLRSDRAVYYQTLGEVVLTGSVEIVSGQDTLTADVVEYDSNTKVAEARGAVRIGDGESTLFAPFVTYDSQAEVSAFEGGGRILHESAVITAPSGTYSSARRFARLDGPVVLEDSSGTLTADRGTYDVDVRRADFAGDVAIRRPDASVDADSVVYFRRTERARGYGRVVLEQIGTGGAGSNGSEGAPADSTRRTFLFGELLLFDGDDETASMRGDDRAEPLLVTLRADSARVDTTVLRAPRIDAARLVVGADTSTVLTAAGGARLWGQRLAAVADSARFVRSRLPDSTEVDRLALFGPPRPSVWADGAQLTGDTLRARTLDGAVDSLSVLGTAFAARLDSTLGRLQQIAGRQMAGLFDGDALRRLSVWSNAQAITFRANAAGQLDGAYEVSADSMAFLFRESELRDVLIYRGIESTAYGGQNAPESARLPGFAYAADGAPTKAGLLGEGWEVGWLERYGPRFFGEPAPPDPGPPASVDSADDLAPDTTEVGEGAPSAGEPPAPTDVEDTD